MKKFFKEFKAFITKGNVIDMAVGVIVGAAFSAIVNSMVKDILMPLIVWIFPVQDLSSLSVTLRPESAAGAGDALLWHYGTFLQAVITFLITALIIFVLLKAIMRAKGFSFGKKYSMLNKKEVKALKAEGKTIDEIKALDDAKVAEKKALDEAAAAEAAANSTEALLKRAVEELEKINAAKETEADDINNKGAKI